MKSAIAGTLSDWAEKIPVAEAGNLQNWIVMNFLPISGLTWMITYNFRGLTVRDRRPPKGLRLVWVVFAGVGLLATLTDHDAFQLAKYALVVVGTLLGGIHYFDQPERGEMALMATEWEGNER